MHAVVPPLLQACTVLMDDDQQKEWLEEFQWFDKIRNGPHARFFTPVIFPTAPSAPSTSRLPYTYLLSIPTSLPLLPSTC